MITARHPWGHASAAIVSCACLFTGPLEAQDGPVGAAYLDGLSVLCGGSPGDESLASPILTSDLELEARLILLRERGAAWREPPVDDALLRRARRSLAFTRILAMQARQVGEAAAPEARARLRQRLEELAGGSEALEPLLRESGVGADDLQAWINDAVLAIAQLTYIRERIEPPTEGELSSLFAAGGHPFEGQDLESARPRFRRYLVQRKLEAALEEWLLGTLSHRTMRLLR